VMPADAKAAARPETVAMAVVPEVAAPEEAWRPVNLGVRRNDGGRHLGRGLIVFVDVFCLVYFVVF
jgi:hypothetical protein